MIEHKTYSMSKSVKTLSIILTVFAIILTASMLRKFVGLSLSSATISLIFVVCLPGIVMIILAYSLWRIRNNRLALDENSVTLSRENKETKTILWDEIENIKSKDLLQQLVISSEITDTVITIDYQFENFDEIRRIILKQAKARNKYRSDHKSAYYKSPKHYMLAFMMLFLGGFIFSSSMEDENFFIKVFFSAIFVLGIFLFFNQEKRLIIKGNILTIEYWFKKTSIDLLSIKSVEIKNKDGNYTDKFPVICVTTKDGQDVEIRGFLGGSTELYNTIYEAWQSANKIR